MEHFVPETKSPPSSPFTYQDSKKEAITSSGDKTAKWCGVQLLSDVSWRLHMIATKDQFNLSSDSEMEVSANSRLKPIHKCTIWPCDKKETKQNKTNNNRMNLRAYLPKDKQAKAEEVFETIPPQIWAMKVKENDPEVPSCLWRTIPYEETWGTLFRVISQTHS